jgi:hypothetical protein
MLDNRPTGEIQVPFVQVLSKFAIQFTRNYNGLVDSAAAPLEPTTPWVVFTNKNYLASSCGFPQFQPTLVRNRDIL